MVRERPRARHLGGLTLLAPDFPLFPWVKSEETAGREWAASGRRVAAGSLVSLCPAGVILEPARLSI